MKLFASAALLCAASMGSAQAQNEVYVCTDDSGGREYKNTGATKGCRKLELMGIPTPPMASQPRRATGNKNGNANGNAAEGAVGGAATNAIANSAAAANFPKVDSAVQKARDNDRKRLLQDELITEQGKLMALNADFNQGEPERRGDERNYAKYQERVAGLKEDIARSERNVEALRRELGKLR